MNAMNTHAFYALLFLVLTICTGGIVLAQAQQPEPATPVISAPVMDESTVVKKTVATQEQPVNPQAKEYQKPACVVTGTVKAVTTVEKSPWDDGTPTTLTTTEIQVTLDLASRTVQRATQDAADCTMPAENTTVIYKLCSPTMVKAGNRVKGVEGLATGSDQSLGCLFDVAVDTAQ